MNGSRGTDVVSQESIRTEQRRQEFARWKGLRHTDLDKQLKRIVGQQAEFRGLQIAGLEAIIAGHARVLIVIRTGGGKSLFFIVPAASSWPRGYPNDTANVVRKQFSVSQKV